MNQWAVWLSGYSLDGSGYSLFWWLSIVWFRGWRDMDNHFCLKMVVEHIPPNLLDELNHFWLASIASPEPFFSLVVRSPDHIHSPSLLVSSLLAL
jgi:hypothetical protein